MRDSSEEYINDKIIAMITHDDGNEEFDIWLLLSLIKKKYIYIYFYVEDTADLIETRSRYKNRRCVNKDGVTLFSS